MEETGIPLLQKLGQNSIISSHYTSHLPMAKEITPVGQAWVKYSPTESEVSSIWNTMDSCIGLSIAI